MLRHCHRNVPFYHRAMKEAGIRPEDVRSLDDLRCLPPVGKAMIRNNPELFRSRYPPTHVVEATTSGSTGEPFRFLRSRDTYHWEVAGSRRLDSWTGYKLGERWANIRGFRGFASPKEAIQTVARDLLLRRLRIDHRKADEEKLRRGARRIASFKPFLVEASPKVLLEFGRFFQLEDATVPVVVSTGEGTTPSERRLLGDLWGSEVFDSYRSGEAMAMASECTQHCGLHVSDELYILEFVKEGEHVSQGEHGRILVTSLYHRAQPFIRYDIGDISTPLDDKCPCGRGLSLMSSVEGRYVDVLQTSAGKLIFASVFSSWVSDVQVRQFQIEQLDRKRLIVRIVPDTRYDRRSAETIASRAKAVMGADIDVTVQEENVIVDYESGKRQIVKSHVRFPAVT